MTYASQLIEGIAKEYYAWKFTLETVKEQDEALYRVVKVVGEMAMNRCDKKLELAFGLKGGLALYVECDEDKVLRPTEYLKGLAKASKSKSIDSITSLGVHVN